ncbi:MAG: lysophospholipid acyltransferase family protein [Bacteroidota bacterium]|nr:lysophospholipid acyltransferase family protein [Candidatus Kapabacteria bacterium]MDW8219082.1 lysophospholipid acyltransferase family protein [Bacteroidota bacterium]
MTLKQRFARWWLSLTGWKVVGDLPPDIKRFVVIGAPHTSNWDLYGAVLGAMSMNFRGKWLGKKELFRFPFGWLMRWLGGIPVDRSRRTNMVDFAAKLLETSDSLGLIIPPEGTRSKTPKWKTGFYYIAYKARVPIICGFMDYAKRELGIGLILTPTGNIHEDIKIIRDFYSTVQGKYPEKMSPVEIDE